MIKNGFNFLNVIEFAKMLFTNKGLFIGTGHNLLGFTIQLTTHTPDWNVKKSGGNYGKKIILRSY